VGKPSKESLLFSELCKKHRERFNVSYGVNFIDRRPISEHIAILENALKTGIPAEVKQMVAEDGIEI
jgi:hypothetical protein